MKSRWWWPYAIASLAVALSSWSLWHSYHTAKDAAVVHRLAAAEPASPSWYANQRGAARFYITDPYNAGGAVGDGAHDDTAAIQAAINNAQAVGGTVVVPQPSVAFGVTSELESPSGSNGPIPIVGETSHYQAQVIRALSSMRSVLQYQGFGSTVHPDWGAGQGLVQNITLDGNNLAKTAFMPNNVEGSHFSNVRAIRGTNSCIRAPYLGANATVGSTTATVPGGSPSGVSYSILDGLVYHAPNHNPTDTLRVTVTTGGTLGTARYTLSIDGAASPASLPMQPTVNLVNEDNAGFVQSLLGVRVSFPAGTYHVNDFYEATVTSPTTVPFGPPQSGDFVLYDHITMAHCGQVYATNALISHFGAYNNTTTAGTATATIGQQILTGSSTSWMSTIDGRGLIQIANNGTVYPFVAILDDFDIAVIHGTEPTATLSGQDYAIALGGDYYEDGGFDEGYSDVWTSFSAGEGSTCFNFGCSLGPTVVSGMLQSCALGGMVIGAGSDSFSTQTVIGSVRPFSGAITNGAKGFIFSPYSNGVFTEPIRNVSIGGVPSGDWHMTLTGVDSPLGPLAGLSYTPLNTLAIHPVTVNITAANQVLPTPDLSFIATQGYTPLGFTSLVLLNSNASYVMNATPVLPAAPQAGVFEVLQNNTAGTVVTFQADNFSNSGLALGAAYRSLQYGDSLTLVSQGNNAFHQYWREVAFSGNVYGSIAAGIGNTGTDVYPLVTTDASSHAIRCWTVNNIGTAPGTILKYDLYAESGATAGTNVAAWLDYQVGWDISGNRFMYVAGTQAGTGAGSSPPLGWTQAPDGSGTPTRCINVQGDASANAVHWTLAATHRDPGR